MTEGFAVRQKRPLPQPCSRARGQGADAARRDTVRHPELVEGPLCRGKPSVFRQSEPSYPPSRTGEGRVGDVFAAANLPSSVLPSPCIGRGAGGEGERHGTASGRLLGFLGHFSGGANGGYDRAGAALDGEPIAG